MIGISGEKKAQIAQKVEDMFDRIAMQFIGDIPRLRNKKLLIFSSESNVGLPNLFVQAMQNKAPNTVEKDFLKGMLNSAYDYLDGLKSRTRANVTERIDSLVREAKFQNRELIPNDIQVILDDELSKAKSQLKTIVEAEATKMRNMGTMMDITRVAGNLGDDDPSVFFIVVKDDVTCKECIRLHLMPDRSTPRIYKFSELKQGYHKRGEDNPSVFGLHPHCRCSLSYLSKGFGFKNGLLTYHSENHDEYSRQRKK